MGAGSSWGAYVGLGMNHRPGRFTTTNLIGEPVVYEFNNEFNGIKFIGVNHNKLLTLINDNNNVDNSIELNWLKNKYENSSAATFSIDSLYNSFEFQRIKKITKDISVEYAKRGCDTEFLLESYRNNNLINDVQYKYFKLYLSLQFKAEDFEDVKVINEFYIKEILNSDLKRKDKKVLLAAIATYIQSYYYWINYELDESVK